MTKIIKIAFQGEPGANSHIAIAEAYPDAEPLPCPTFEDALAATAVFDEAFLAAVAGGEASGRLDVSLEQQARLGRETMLHRLEILVLVGAFAVLFAVYAFVAWRVYLEYKKILGGTDLGDIEKLLDGTDPMKLLEGLDPTRRLPPELR